MKIVDVTENVFQVRAFKNGISVISKLFPNVFEDVAVDYCSLFMNLHIIFYCGNRHPAGTATL